MAKLSYLERQQQSQSDKDQQAQQFQAEQAELQLLSDISATKQSVLVSKQLVEEAKSATNFDAKIIITAMDNLAAAESGLEALLELQKELFPKK